MTLRALNISSNSALTGTGKADVTVLYLSIKRFSVYTSTSKPKDGSLT